MTKKLTRGLAIGASTAALLGGMLLTAPVAFASSQGCTGTNLRTDPAMICTSVEGESTHVKSIQASIDIQNYTCNADFKVWGTYANDKPYSDTGHAKCGVGRVWVDFKPPHGQFKDGTKVCGALVENGKVRREHACIEIEK